MVNAITGPPNDYKFGLNFNYAVWTPGTVLSLVNVPWNNDYRDIVRFTNKEALNTYITGLEPTGTRIEKLSYVKPNTPVRVNLPINKAIVYNYLRASNPIQPIPGMDIKKDYYYFITDVRYLSPNTTELVLQLDVWQTFGYDVTFGSSYVERGHIGIAAENNFDSFGRDYLTVPEGFDLGGEYRTLQIRYERLMERQQNLNPGGSSFTSDVIVVSTVDLTESGGTAAAPELVAAKGGVIEAGIAGAEVRVFDFGQFQAFMTNKRNQPWVTQGIISAKAMPKINRYDPDFPYEPTGALIGEYRPMPRLKKHFTNWREASWVPGRYSHLKKFWTYPYMGIELTCFTGNSVVLKPESWQSPDAEVMERATFTPPSTRVDFIPRYYNAAGTIAGNYMGLPDAYIASQPANIRDNLYNTGDDYGDYLDVAVGITNFPTLPMVNNGQLGYLASNNSTINYQRQSADWSQQRSLNAASTGYDQASKGLETAQALNQIGINADIAQTGNVNRTQVAQSVVSAGTQIVGGALGGAGGGPAGVAMGALGSAVSAGGNLINTGIQVGANDEALAIRNAAAAGTLAANQSQGSYIRDTNKSLADWSARGDYANEIAGINAKVQDAAMIQPSVSGQFGGETINTTHGTMQMSLRWKMIDNASIRRIGEFWLRYGYRINMPVFNLPQNMMVMSKFTYWKLTETYLQSSPMPETFKQAIRGIFEKGVTVWAAPEYIGNTDFADNAPIEGITL